MNLADFGYSRTYTLPVATTGTLGGVKVGTGLTATTGGILSALVASSIVSAEASGTGYTMTDTYAAVAFGGVSPSIVIPSAGTWLISHIETTEDSGLTMTNGGSVKYKLTRTNNTPGDLGEQPARASLPAVTTDSSLNVTTGNDVIYTTANANDVIAIYGATNATIGAGSFICVNATIRAIKLY